METLISLLATLNTLSPLAVIALLGLVIFMLVKAKEAKSDVDAKVATITDNHLHGLPDMEDSLKRIENLLQNMNDNIIYIRARVNGSNK